MTVTVPSQTDVTITGTDPSPVEILAQLRVEIDAVVDDETEISQRVDRTERGEPNIVFECLDGSQPAVDIIVRSSGLYELRKCDGSAELPTEQAPDLDSMATLVVRHFRQSAV